MRTARQWARLDGRGAIRREPVPRAMVVARAVRPVPRSPRVRRRGVLAELEELRHQRNRVSDQIANLKKDGEDAKVLVEQMRAVSANIKMLEQELAVHQETLDKILLEIPNIPHASVPLGKDAADNSLVKQVGTPPHFEYDAQAHWDIGTRLGILDFERAAKITGARFPLYIGIGAHLERALINFMLDMLVDMHV